MLTIKIGSNLKNPCAHPFPKLMQAKNGLIVFFKKSGEGTIIKENISFGRDGLAWHSTDWNMQEFVDFDGEITISQKLDRL